MKLSQKSSRIINLAWPAILSYLTYTVVSLVDMWMVGSLGPSAVAAVGLGSLLLWIAYSIMASVSVGTTALVARFKGSGAEREKSQVMAQSILIMSILSILITIAGFFFSEEIIRLMGAEREVYILGGEYLRTIFLSSFFIFLAFTSESGLRGAGDTRTPMKIDLIINTLNIILDYVLIFGKIGLPALGVMGAGISSALAFSIGGLLHLGVLLRGRSSVKLELNLLKPNLDMIKRLMHIGVPASLGELVTSVAFTAYTAIIVAFGTLSLAATQIGIRIEAFSFMPGIGFSIAAAALVGQSLGARDEKTAYATGWQTAKLALLFMGSVGVLIFIFAPRLAEIFTSDPEVIRLGALYLRIVAILQPFQAVLFVLTGSLNGAGDTRWVLYTTIVGLWFVRLPLAYLTGVFLGLGVLAAWLAMVVDVIVRSLILTLRYRSRKWIEVRV